MQKRTLNAADFSDTDGNVVFLGTPGCEEDASGCHRSQSKEGHHRTRHIVSRKSLMLRCNSFGCKQLSNRSFQTVY